MDRQKNTPVAVAPNQSSIIKEIPCKRRWDFLEVPRRKQNFPKTFVSRTVGIFICVAMLMMHAMGGNPTNRSAHTSHHYHIKHQALYEGGHFDLSMGKITMKSNGNRKVRNNLTPNKTKKNRPNHGAIMVDLAAMFKQIKDGKQRSTAGWMRRILRCVSDISKLNSQNAGVHHSSKIRASLLRRT